MWKFFAVLFVTFTGGDFWLSAFVNLLVIAAISLLIAAIIKWCGGDETYVQLFSIITMLSVVGAVISLLIFLLKIIF
ncbi:MAG: hypothetical protein ACI4VQ_02650 [Clostridia bacterium]